jgi:hypothetical protein
MGIQIKRVKPRSSRGEYPTLTSRGYVLGDPQLVPVWHTAEHAVYVNTLEEAAELIEQRGFAIRMSCPGYRPSLIRPSGLRIVRE